MSLSHKMIEVALAALLHDVGKLYERTGQESEKLDHLFKYSHATFTSLFFEELQKNSCDWSGVSLDRIKNLASYHHNPSEPIQHLIAVADHCSAGERLSLKETGDNPKEFRYGKSRRRLVSLFSQINLQPRHSQGKNSWWKYDPVSLYGGDEHAFPQSLQTENDDSGEEKYRQLYKRFCEHIHQLNHCPAPLLVDAMMGICRSFWSLVPSSARSDEIPDVTLYDHSVVSAAIACALFARHQSQEHADALPADQETPKMLLVSGDISGIQDFLLDLPNQASPGTAKLLRARSFYITILARAAIVVMLDRFGLPGCNCLKEAGGQFTLLLHNTPEIRRELFALQKQFDEWMLRTFQGRLALILSEPVAIDDSDFQEGRYVEFAEQLKVQTDIAKKRKFHSTLQGDSQWNIGDDSLAVTDTVPPDERALDEQLKRLGSQLTSRNFITFSSRTDKSNEKPDKISFFDALTLELHEDADTVPWRASKLLAALQINPDSSQTTSFAAPYEMTRHVPRLNSEEAEELNERRSPDEDEWFAGQVKPFELIAKSAQGVPCLAVLKADVDRLGQIFSRGLKPEFASLSRLSVLSRLLNGFFTHILEHRLQSKQEYENVYTEYAGGDDLLFVGPWSVVFQLAQDIRELFCQYTCQNEDITLSAAIVLGHAKQPISSLVRQAESLLDRAKSEGRNRIALFDTTVTWDDFDSAMKDGYFLFESVHKSQGKIARGLPYRLLRYYQMYLRAKEKGSIRDLLWKSQLRYDLGRNLPYSTPENQPLRDRIDQMTTIDAMDRLKIAATYALYLGR